MGDRREFHSVVLAALLHDIGKFLQRGRDLPFHIDGHHPQVSERFISAFAETFSQVADIELLKTLVTHHHRGPSFSGFRPDDIAEPRARALAFLINKADGLSASERGQHAEQWQDYKTVPLAPVFLRVDANQDKPVSFRYHPIPLTLAEALSERLFPDGFDKYSPGELEETLKTFGEQANPLLRALGADFDSLLSHLLALLAAHTWPIPADTQEEIPDTSLYDHLRTTAAIAACLYQHYDARDTWSEASKSGLSGEPFCLAVGDVSGIQDYIFGIASGKEVGGGVARRLRARSLYIQLISEVVPLQILKRFELPLTNILMASGGKFYLLLPNLERIEEILTAAQSEADRWFLKTLNGDLGLNLAWVPFGEDGFKGFGGVLASVTASLVERKERRFRQALTASGRWQPDEFLLSRFETGQQACPSCGHFPASEEPDKLCHHCQDDLTWGKQLPQTQRGYIVISDSATGADRDMLGAGVSLRRDLASITKRPSLVLRLNEPDTLPAAKFPASFRYLVNHVPAEKEVVLDFESMAKKSKGRPYLAFLKADVDRLGEVFAFGLKGCGSPVLNEQVPPCPTCGKRHERWDTVSRLATLSRQLDFFFTGWVQHLLATEYAYCYSVFSGGDDLFLVGPWDNILELAERLRNDFSKYTCQNKSFTLSAGIVVAQDSLPIAQAAREVDAALEKSKDGGRNSITLLGHTLTWQDWEKVRGKWHELRGEAEGISSGFLYSLLEYGEMWRDYRVNGNVLGLRFQPLLAYNLTRNVDSRKFSKLHQWAQSLVDFSPGDKEKERELMLNNLGLLAQLLILGKGGPT